MQNNQPGRVLIIAGSDSGGGAGIQADIKTVTMLGGYASTAITAITAQNTLGVTHVEAVRTKMVVDQVRAVLSDIGADVIKTGMLFSAEIIHAVADELDRSGYQGKLVIDPVMVATSGDPLMEGDAVQAIKDRLVPRATIITPNLPEAYILTNIEISNYEKMIEAGTALIDAGSHSALIKGGHGEADILTDLLVTASGSERFDNPRINSKHTHGTGCTLASAIAAHLAHGDDLAQAVEASIAFLRSAIERAPGFGAGHGPVGHQAVRSSW